MEIKLRIAMSILIVAMVPVWGLATDLKPIGEYRQVRAGESGHCYGPDVKLWQKGAGGLVGVLTYFDGACSDAACSLVQGRRSGASLFFSASERINDKSFRFQGDVNDQGLSGDLNSKPVKLASGSQLKRKSFESWCSDWRKVSRCKGVAAYCRNLHNQ